MAHGHHALGLQLHMEFGIDGKGWPMVKKKRHKPVDALHIIVNARSYLLAALVIEKQPINPMLLWPKLACIAFSLELHLKCLHRVRRRYSVGHNAKRIFEKLSKADRKRIAELHDKKVKKHPGYSQTVSVKCGTDFESVLVRASDLFEKTRYWHEQILPHADSLGAQGSFGMDCLIDAVKDVILESKPDLLERAKSVKITTSWGEYSRIRST